jgi:flagellar motor switch protein FliM
MNGEAQSLRPYPGMNPLRGTRPGIGDKDAPRPLDLTGRERQLRAAMQAMSHVAARFARAARRTLPFLVRRRARLAPEAVYICDAGSMRDTGEGPTFEVMLESEELGAWGSLSLNADAIALVLEGSLGGRDGASLSAVANELTLAQRALVGRIARSLAEDFASAVREEAGLSLAIISCHALAAGDPKDQPGPDGLAVDCLFQGIPGNPTITVSISAEALEAAAREHEVEQPVSADPRMTEAVRDVPVEVVVELGRITLGLRRVLGLKVGQVLRLPTAVDDPVTVRVAGINKFAGSPVISRGQLSVEIKGRHGE